MAAGQGVEIGTEPVLPHTVDLWVSLMQGKGLTAPTLPAFPGRELNMRARRYRWLKIVHPAGFNLFEKPCPRLWTNLGMEDQLIKNMNLIKLAT